MNGLKLLWELAGRIESIAMQIESEDKLAADWVKSVGGLDRVSAAWEWVHRRGGIEALEKRLMPENLEWPRFEDGEPVRFGREFESEGAVDVVESVTFHCAGSPRFNYGLQDSGERVHGIYVRGERIKRPAPKVLDADGVEIRAGDVLYSVETGESVTVEQVEPGNPWFAATSGTLQHCSKFTHKRPDSWERLEEDAENANPVIYCKEHGLDCEDMAPIQAVRVDLVRRARALAGGA